MPRKSQIDWHSRWKAIVTETKAPEVTEEKEQLEEIEDEQQEQQPEQQKILTPNRQQGRALSLSSLNEVNNLAESDVEVPAQGRLLEQLSTKYAKLVVDQGPGQGYIGATWTSARAKADANDDECK